MVRHANQDRYKKRQKNRRGMVQVAVWVPEAGRDTILELAEQLRDGFTPEEGATHDKEEPNNRQVPPVGDNPRRRTVRRR